MFFIFSMVFFLVFFFLFVFMSFINLSKLLKTFLSPKLDFILFVSALISSINFIALLKSFLERSHFGNSISFDSSSFFVSPSSVNFLSVLLNYSNGLWSNFFFLTSLNSSLLSKSNDCKHCKIFRKAHQHFS